MRRVASRSTGWRPYAHGFTIGLELRLVRALGRVFLGKIEKGQSARRPHRILSARSGRLDERCGRVAEYFEFVALDFSRARIRAAA